MSSLPATTVTFLVSSELSWEFCELQEYNLLTACAPVKVFTVSTFTEEIMPRVTSLIFHIYNTARPLSIPIHSSALLAAILSQLAAL